MRLTTSQFELIKPYMRFRKKRMRKKFYKHPFRYMAKVSLNFMFKFHYPIELLQEVVPNAKGDFIWKHLKPTTEYHQPVIVPFGYKGDVV